MATIEEAKAALGQEYLDSIYNFVIQSGQSPEFAQFNVDNAVYAFAHETGPGGAPLPQGSAITGVPPFQGPLFAGTNINRVGTSTSGGVAAANAIMDKYRRGEYGQVGSPGAREGAIRALAQLYANGGIDAATSATNAKAYFDSFAQDESITGGGDGAGDSKVRSGETILPGFNEEVKRQELRRELPTGALFGAALEQQAPLGGPSPWRAYLSKQEGPLTDLYRLGQASGDVPGETNFKDFLTSRGGISRVGPESFLPYARRGAEALTGSVAGMSNQMATWRDYFRGVTEDNPEGNPNVGQGRQFDVGFASAYPELAREFRGIFAGGARRAFEKFRYDNPNSEFLPWFVGRGQQFY